MEHMLTVTEAAMENNTLKLYPIEEWPVMEWKKLKDGMRMLADSNALTFVYVLDTEEAFIQLRLPKQIWPQLAEAVKQQAEVTVEGPTSIILHSFQQEMDYLLDNIPGNSNYGNEMVNAVEDNFLPQND